MTYWELVARLTELAGARGPAADRLLHEIRGVADERWFDARVAEEVRSACLSRGLVPPPLEPRPLAVGESWVLLHEPGNERGQVARLVASPAPAAAIDAESAYRGLRASCGRLCRALPERGQPTGFVVEAAHARERPVTGRSLGVAACAALVSRALGRPGRTDTAASAVVEINGRLTAVDHLEEKLRAARESHPQIERVVVARGQDSTDGAGLALVGVDRLEEALAELGLDLRALPGGTLDDHQLRLDGFAKENRKGLDREGWRRLARDAWETMQAFVADPGSSGQAAESGSWAALFSLHAGDTELAEAALDEVRGAFAEQIQGWLAAWCAIVDASRAVDARPEAAPTLAQAALALCEALEGPHRTELRGMALGTLGRALMHAGRPDLAENPLREALAHHREHARLEVPRSGCYLATCLRLRGRTGEALALTAEMGALCDDLPRWTGPATTRLYLSLERGRCLLAAGDPAGAVEALAVAAASDTDYPRVSALRALAEARRRLGDDGTAWRLTRSCLEISRRHDGVLAQIATLAAGDALLSEVSDERRRQAQVAWRRVFAAETPEAIAAELARAIY